MFWNAEYEVVEQHGYECYLFKSAMIRRGTHWYRCTDPLWGSWWWGFDCPRCLSSSRRLPWMEPRLRRFSPCFCRRPLGLAVPPGSLSQLPSSWTPARRWWRSWQRSPERGWPASQRTPTKCNLHWFLAITQSQRVVVAFTFAVVQSTTFFVVKSDLLPTRSLLTVSQA